MGASPVFKAMLTSGMEEAMSKSIDIKDFSHATVEYFLEYLYTGRVCLEDDDTVFRSALGHG